MQVIHDAPADGPANMQRDLHLLKSLGDDPILRIHQCSGYWISYGYFQTEGESRAQFPTPDLQFVQRPTGGGIVDHPPRLHFLTLGSQTPSLSQALPLRLLSPSSPSGTKSPHQR